MKLLKIVMHLCGLLDCWVCIHRNIARARKHLLKSKANMHFFEVKSALGLIQKLFHILRYIYYIVLSCY